MSEIKMPAWYDCLKKAIQKNRRDAHNRYIQLATLSETGKPRVRMVVFRGFSETTSALFIITDSRSRKIQELQRCSEVEVGWYFTQSREQFRLQCDATLHTSESDRGAHRARIWRALSDSARAQFFWKEPGAPLGVGSELNVSANPPDTFVVVELAPDHVDHLILAKRQLRTISTLTEVGWQEMPVNP